MNTRPEVIQRESQDEVPRYHTCRRTARTRRWLCRTNGAIIVAPSGMGKSSCSFQTAILWSCGRSAFGIKPPKPWRILILQAEDDDDDTTEMCAMLDNPKLGLIDPEKQLVERNTHLDLERK